MSRRSRTLAVAVGFVFWGAGLAAAQGLTGTRTVGGSGEFATLGDAVNALNSQGVGAGGVTFEILAGYYGIPPILQASGAADRPIGFRPAAGAAVLLDHWTLRGSYISVHDLVFSSTGVHDALRICGSHNTVRGCSITAANGAGIVLESGSRNRVLGNVISACINGIRMFNHPAFGGTFHNEIDGNVIAGCTLGILVDGTANDIARNTIEMRDSAISRGIWVNGSAQRVHHNRIRFDNVGSTAGSGQNGASFIAIVIAARYAVVAFNSIRMSAGGSGTSEGSAIGILFQVASGVSVKNNVLSGLAVKSAATGNLEMWLLGIAKSGYDTTPGVSFFLDHNCYHLDPSSTGTIHVAGHLGGSSYDSLADWRSASGAGTDVNSLEADPRFVAGENLHLASDSPCRGHGRPLPGLWVDSDGDVWKSFVDIGADQFVAPRLPGDGNGDGKVDAADYVVLRNNWGRTSPARLGRADGDYTFDGIVDFADWRLWATHYGGKDSPADGNGDGIVDLADYDVLSDNFYRTSAPPLTAADGDYNLDGVVDSADYAVWRAHYGQTQP